MWSVSLPSCQVSAHHTQTQKPLCVQHTFNLVYAQDCTGVCGMRCTRWAEWRQTLAYRIIRCLYWMRIMWTMRNGKGQCVSSLGEQDKRHGAGPVVARQRVCYEQEVSWLHKSTLEGWFEVSAFSKNGVVQVWQYTSTHTQTHITADSVSLSLVSLRATWRACILVKALGICLFFCFFFFLTIRDSHVWLCNSDKGTHEEHMNTHTDKKYIFLNWFPQLTLPSYFN